MKKLLVSLLALVLVFAVVARVSADAPVVTGKLQYEAYTDVSPADNVPGTPNPHSYADARLFFNGDIDKETNYLVSLQYTSTSIANNFKVREAYATYKTDFGNLSVGKIRVFPSIADLTDGVTSHLGNGITAAPFVIRYGYNLSDNTNFGLTVVPVDTGDETDVTSYSGAGAFVAEAHTKVSIVNLGVNYQSEGKGDAGYALQASTTLFGSLNLWAEAGKLADQTQSLSSDEKKVELFGASLTINKLTFEVEKQFNDKAVLYGHDQWGAKVGYALTKNTTLEYYRSSNYYLGGLDAVQNPGTVDEKDTGVNFFRVTVTF